MTGRLSSDWKKPDEPAGCVRASRGRVGGWRLLATLLVGALLVGSVGACGEAGDDPQSVAPQSSEPAATPPQEAAPGSASPSVVEDSKYRPCSVDERVGRFRVEMHDEYTAAAGAVLSDVSADRLVDVVSEVGNCQLLRPRVLECSPGCGVEQQCSGDNECTPVPITQSVGTVTVTGLVDELEMEPSAGSGRYSNRGVLTHPGVLPDAELQLVAAGADVEAFQIAARGVPPLEIDPELSTGTGRAMEVRWSAAPQNDWVRVRLELNVNNHGATAASVVCEVEDTGSFDIPEPLITELTGIGVSGFPTLAAGRRSAGSVVLASGCVDFVMTTVATLDIDLDGVVSCDSDEVCTPFAQECGPTLHCVDP